MRSFGLSYEHVRKCGSLVVAWTEEQLAKLPEVLAENREAGDTEAQLLPADELRAFEPALGSSALGAVFCPREAVVEPWLVAHGYAESARLHGAQMSLSSEVVSADYLPAHGCWEVAVRPSGAQQRGRSLPGELLVRPPVAQLEAKATGAAAAVRDAQQHVVRARVVINCAGLYGDIVDSWGPSSNGASGSGSAAAGIVRTRTSMADASAQVSPEAPFHLNPRKGQFVVLQPAEGSPPLRSVLELVATQFTKGVIIWQTVYGNVVIGPTAEPQRSREDRSTDGPTVASLLEHGARCVPHLQSATVLGTYAGLRPATEHRDYQIRAVPMAAPPAATDAAQGGQPSQPATGWITVAGIRSTGLTCAPGIGEYVAELYVGLRDQRPPEHASQQPPVGPASPDGCYVGVTHAAHHPIPLEPTVSIRDAPVPTLAELAASYRQRGDGRVELYGKLRRVTHPIASFGMASMRDSGPDSESRQ